MGTVVAPPQVGNGFISDLLHLITHSFMRGIAHFATFKGF
jgi:hypothetical protein